MARKRYTVKRNQSWFDIAKATNNDASTLTTVNPGVDKLIAGQVIDVPVTTAPEVGMSVYNPIIDLPEEPAPAPPPGVPPDEAYEPERITPPPAPPPGVPPDPGRPVGGGGVAPPPPDYSTGGPLEPPIQPFQPPIGWQPDDSGGVSWNETPAPGSPYGTGGPLEPPPMPGYVPETSLPPPGGWPQPRAWWEKSESEQAFWDAIFPQPYPYPEGPYNPIMGGPKAPYSTEQPLPDTSRQGSGDPANAGFWYRDEYGRQFGVFMPRWQMVVHGLVRGEIPSTILKEDLPFLADPNNWGGAWSIEDLVRLGYVETPSGDWIIVDPGAPPTGGGGGRGGGGGGGRGGGGGGGDKEQPAPRSYTQPRSNYTGRMRYPTYGGGQGYQDFVNMGLVNWRI